MSTQTMPLDRVVRIAGRVLMVLQAGLIGVFAYHIIDAYVTPYKSEWLTADAFVPYLILGIFVVAFCMFLTNLVVDRSEHRYSWLWVLFLAGVTAFPYWDIVHDAITFWFQ